jgi:hypothetical protein
MKGRNLYLHGALAVNFKDAFEIGFTNQVVPS